MGRFGRNAWQDESGREGGARDFMMCPNRLTRMERPRRRLIDRGLMAFQTVGGSQEGHGRMLQVCQNLVCAPRDNSKLDVLAMLNVSLNILPGVIDLTRRATEHRPE